MMQFLTAVWLPVKFQLVTSHSRAIERFFPDLWKEKNFRDVFQALLFIFFNRQMVTLNCIHEKKKLKIDLVVSYYAL